MSDKKMIRVEIAQKKNQWNDSFKEWLAKGLSGSFSMEVEISPEDIATRVENSIQRGIERLIEQEVVERINTIIRLEVTEEVVRNLMKEVNLEEEVKKNMSATILRIVSENVAGTLGHIHNNGTAFVPYNGMR